MLQGSALPKIIVLGGVCAGLYFAKEQGYLDGLLGVAPAPLAKVYHAQGLMIAFMCKVMGRGRGVEPWWYI